MKILRKQAILLTVSISFSLINVFGLQNNLLKIKNIEISIVPVSNIDKIKTDIYPNNGLIQYTGRIDFSDTLRPKFQTPGACFKYKFSGTSCNILLNDLGRNYLEVVVDEDSAFRIKTQSGFAGYIITNLTNTEHTILVCKNTEVNIGPIEFIGISGCKLLPLPEKPTRKLEFYGNSITCGTGSDMSMVQCGKGKWEDQHNAYMSYGAVVARKLNAQWHLSSYSGIGLIHSCCNIGFTMPDVFNKTALLPTSTDWDFSKYVPDAVTICLGQNDGIQDSSTFCSAYIQFIKQLRSKYPQAYIVCLTSPMADEKLKEGLKKYITSIVLAANNSGDTKVCKYFFSKSWNGGCDSHPSLAEHQEIAKELEVYLKTILSW